MEQLIKHDMVIIRILTVIIVLLYGVYAFVSVERSTDGIRLAKTEREIVIEKVKQGEMKEELGRLQSLSYIDQKARKMGFVPAEGKYIYFNL